jgi:hypothetical protein
MKEHICEKMEEYNSQLYYSDLYECWKYMEITKYPLSSENDSQKINVLYCPLCGIKLENI